ncbi:uncharacterized protein LOC113235841 [Hyposmocoma kahamanoa]|uniref:uncharacterized protein LOC113235841 n=1 Tax=Hyposmocoma kahamanoa TaxID=1477025 RepID=UPI000E6D95B6|nr:uncharacterized protein LOC113235841 [Hyposmocoma kahamanoa]
MGTFRLLCWHWRFAHRAVFWALIMTAAALDGYDEPPGDFDYWEENNIKHQQIDREEATDRTEILLQRLLKILQKQQHPKPSLYRQQLYSLEKIHEDSNWPGNDVEKRNSRPPRRPDLMLRLQRVYNVNKEKHLRRNPQVCLFKLCPSGYSKRYFQK